MHRYPAECTDAIFKLPAKMETEKADHSPSARRLAELELRFELERKHTQSRHKLIESGLEIERIYSFLLQELMQIDEDKMREMTNRVSRLEKGAMKCQEETVSPHRAQPVAVNSVHKVQQSVTVLFMVLGV